MWTCDAEPVSMQPVPQVDCLDMFEQRNST